MSSYNGKLIRLNLTSRQSRVEEIPEKWMKEYLGGRGIGVRYLYQELKPGVEPLSADNKVILWAHSAPPRPCRSPGWRW